MSTKIKRKRSSWIVKIFKLLIKLLILSMTLFSSIFWISFALIAAIIYSHVKFEDPKFPLVGYWLILEALFLLFTQWQLSKSQSIQSKKHLPPLDFETFEALKEEIELYESMDSFLSGWFLNTPSHYITKKQVVDWLSAILFHKDKKELADDELNIVNNIFEKVEKKLQNNLAEKEDGNIDIKSIKLCLDEIRIYPRPLVYYLGILMLDISFKSVLVICFGFVPYSREGHNYFIRRGKHKGDIPIVFFHGLGIGLGTYISLIVKLIRRFPTQTIYLFEMPSISMRLNFDHLLAGDVAEHVAWVLSTDGYSKTGGALMMGHSFGTSCLVWMDRFHPSLVHSRVFIDPICFCLWNHHIAFNALYRVPKTTHEMILKYLATSELGIACYLHRYFCWFQNTYFTRYLPEQAVVFLSSHDDIVDSPSVASYLRKTRSSFSAFKLFVMDSFRHGQILASSDQMNLLVDQIDILLEGNKVD